MGLLSSLFGGQPTQQPPAALTPNTPTVQQIDTAANPGHGLLFGNYRDPAQEMAQLALFSQLASGQTVQDQMNLAPTLIPMQQAMAAKQMAADTKNKTVAMLQQKAPELATAVASGALSPSDALAQMFKQEADAKNAAKYQFANVNGHWLRSNPVSGDSAEIGDYTNPNANLTPDQKNYAQAVKEGFTGSLVDYQQAVKTRGNNDVTAFQKDLKSAGFEPGTPEWNQQILAHYKKSGMTIESDGKGGFRLVQGDVNTPAKLTEDQSKNIGWLERGNAANDELTSLDTQLTNPTGYLAGQLGTAGNYLKTPEYQKAERAGRDFLAVVLRKDSGGAITPEEIATYGKIYLPQPGEDPATVKAKADARRTILDSIKAGLGGATDQTRTAPGTATQPVTAVNPQTGQRLMLQNGQWVPMK